MKPKLLLIADTYYPKVDGTLKFMEEFLQRSRHDFEISLLVPDFGIRKGNNITYVETSKYLNISGYPSIKLSFKNISLIKKTIKEADLVFIQGPALLSYISIYYSSKLGKKTLFYLHTISWELFQQFAPPFLNKLLYAFVKRMSTALYNRCDELLVPYPELKDHLTANGVKTSINIAKLGVDIDLFSPPKDSHAMRKKLHLPLKEKIIGYVGRVSKEKNVTVLRQAFHKLASKNTHLLIVGDGPEDQIVPFRTTSRCTVTGFVNNVQDYLQAMDIFVMPSLTETTSLTTLEAMASGLPVIATKVGFIKEYISKDYNGIFFPKNSSSFLAVKIEKLLKSPVLRQKLGQNARKTIVYSFSWDRSINRIKRILLHHI
ncbi:TPA: glycosyltransferase family 1 protein [Candidatus Woesearchaeota archaeon]|nr:glycosyltransferase family 1 protein [Candidatus Woesearchaeota archaeon]